MPPAGNAQVQRRDDHVADDVALNATAAQQAPSKDDAAAAQSDSTPRLTHPGTVALPEQVVGSVHEFPIAFPYNLDRRGRAAQMKAVAMDDRFKLIASEKTVPSLFGPAGKTPPFATANLVFTPQKPGLSTLFVQFNATWDDGYVEQLEVQVLVNARSLENQPVGGASNEEAPARAPVVDTRPPTLDLFNSKVDELKLHLNDVAHSQVEGVDVVDAEAAKYTEPTPAPPTWAVLAELAITIGTAGVAAIVGKYVATKIVGLATKEEAAAQTVAKDAGDAVSDGTKHAGEHVATEAAHKATEHAGADAAKHVAEHAAEHGGAGKHYAIEGLATGLEDALKDSIKLKVPEHEAKEEEQEGDEEGGVEVVSKDPRIQFFHTQRRSLGEAQVGQGTDMIHILDGLRGLADVMPDAAIKAVEAIQGGLEAGKKAGPKHQREATAAKWVDFVAQGKHGTEKAGNKTVTKLDRLHRQIPEGIYGSEWINWQNAVAGKGVLEITLSFEDDHLGVESVRLDGVSRLIGDRLLKMDLRTAGIPLRLVTTTTHSGVPRDVITVDEAGNVRTGGPLQYEKNTENEGEAKGEAQNIRGAQHIVDKVLSKTLSAWGISHVESDDKSK
jgi:hypothetical protein